MDRTTPSPPRRPRVWPLIVISSALVLGPVAWGVARPEIARWHIAAAREALLDGAYVEADASIEKALRWNPDAALAYQTRAEVFRELDDIPAAADALLEALALTPNNSQRIPLLTQIAEIQQELGAFSEAVDTWERIVEMSEQDPRFMHSALLNGLAYARALAGRDLELALENVNRAIELAQGGPTRPVSVLFRPPPEDEDAPPPYLGMIDTRGLIHFEMGNLELAREDFDLVDKHLEAWTEQQRSDVRMVLENTIDIRELPKARRQIDHTVAVLLYHRALVLAAQGEEVEALGLLQRVVSLGFTPGPELY